MTTTRFDQENVEWPPNSSRFKPITIFAALDGAQADEVIWTPSDGLKIVLMGFLLSKETDGKVTFKGSIKGNFASPVLVAGENLFMPSGQEPFWVGGIGETLDLDTVGIDGTFLTLWGHEDSSK